mgnify:CR=1 FL=1
MTVLAGRRKNTAHGNLYALLDRVADTPTTVLVTGISGFLARHVALQLLQSWLIPRLAYYALMPKELFGLI